jgi:hypothetical protein
MALQPHRFEFQPHRRGRDRDLAPRRWRRAEIELFARLAVDLGRIDEAVARTHTLYLALGRSGTT